MREPVKSTLTRARSVLMAAVAICTAGAAPARAAVPSDIAPRRYDGTLAVVAGPEPTSEITTDAAPVVAPAMSRTAPEPRSTKRPAAARDRPPAPRIPKFAVRTRGVTVQPWVRQTTLVEWYRQNYNTATSDDGFVALVGRVNLGQETRARRLTIGNQLRVDGQKVWFPGGRDCGQTATCVPVGDDVRLERATARIEANRWGLVAGDFNANTGRGLGLSVRKIDEIGVDATIKGGRADLRTSVIRATALAGLANRQNSDFATRQLIPDPGYPARSYTFAPEVGQRSCDVTRALDPKIGHPVWTVCSDFVAGGRVEAALPGRVDLAAHYTHVDFGDEISAGVVDEHLHEAGAELARARIGGVWDIFVGASGIDRNPNLRGTRLQSGSYRGVGVYSANTFIRDATTVLLEFKHYEDYLLGLTQASLMQYAENPTLEREDQQVPGNVDATGGRIRVDHTWRAHGVTLFANSLEYVYAENLDQSAFDRDVGRLATHNFAGVIWRRPRSDLVLQVTAGYRYERWLRAPEGATDVLRRRFPHAEVYATIPLRRGRAVTHTLTVRAEGRWETFVTTGQREEFFRGLVQLGYSASPWFSMTYSHGFDTELAAPAGEPSLTDERCSSAVGSTCRPHLWPGVQLQVKLFDASFVRVFAGRQVGGRLCVNGSCRTLPDFEGIRSEFVFGF